MLIVRGRMGLTAATNCAMGYVRVRWPGMAAPYSVSVDSSVDSINVASCHWPATAVGCVCVASHTTMTADIPSAPTTAEAMTTPTVAVSPV